MSTQFAPDTADGWSVIHQFCDIDWKGLNDLDEKWRTDCIEKTAAYFAEYENKSDLGQSALYHILGHKGPLLLLHFRKTFKDCAQVELDIARLPISPYLTVKDSYVSVVELGMYHTTKKVIDSLLEQGLKPHSDEWKEAYSAKIEPHKENLMERRFTEIPERDYFCFYPMDKRRGEKNNWYTESIAERASYMMEHGMTGRRYAGRVSQIISGSIGFDDWEWGVDLFANDPLDIKSLIYEMRFDEATSLFGEFGKFYFGTRVKVNEIKNYFDGKLT